MQQSAKHYVIWNERKGSYEIRDIRPIISSLFGFKPDSAEWFSWLQRVSSFHFQSKEEGRFTARKETRSRGGVYWIAYRHVQGKLRKKYIGSTPAVTLARLEQVAHALDEQ